LIDLGTLSIGVKVNKDEATKDLNSVSDSIEKSENKIDKSMSNVSKAVIGAFSVAAITEFGKKTIEASADIQAMEAQFNQVFKDDENSQAIGRIDQQVVDLGINADRLTDSWNKFGGQVKGAGMESEQALEAVDKATRLAADSAAFYDRSLEDSSASLASFMKGNFAAGDAIGVFTNAKQMDVKANEMYGKSWADLSESERQWLLLDTVEKTYEMNGAMGQASREADSYENVMGNLRATFERAYATIGEPVLEVFLDIVQWVTEGVENLQKEIENGTSIFNVFGNAVNFVKNNMDIILPVITGVTAAFAAQVIVNTVSKAYNAFKIATEGTTIAQAALNAIMNANPFGVVAMVIGGLVAAGVALYKNWDVVKEKAGLLSDVLSGVFSGIVDIAQGVANTFWNIVDAVKAAIEWIKSWNDTDAKEKDVGGSGNNRQYRSSHASGLDYVPFNNYVANLHEGEAVLTAQQAEQWRSGNTSNVNIVVNATVREESDIKKIRTKQRGTVSQPA